MADGAAVGSANGMRMAGSFNSVTPSQTDSTAAGNCNSNNNNNNNNNSKLTSIVKKEQLEYEFRLRPKVRKTDKIDQHSQKNKNEGTGCFLSSLSARIFTSKKDAYSRKNPKKSGQNRFETDDMNEADDDEDFYNNRNSRLKVLTDQFSFKQRFISCLCCCCCCRNASSSKNNEDRESIDTRLSNKHKKTKGGKPFYKPGENKSGKKKKQNIGLVRRILCCLGNARRKQGNLSTSSSNDSISGAHRMRMDLGGGGNNFSNKYASKSKNKNKMPMSSDGDLYDSNADAQPPPVTCIRVLRPSNDLTPVKFDSHYNIIQSASLGSLGGMNSSDETENETDDQVTSAAATYANTYSSYSNTSAQGANVNTPLRSNNNMEEIDESPEEVNHI